MSIILYIIQCCGAWRFYGCEKVSHEVFSEVPITKLKDLRPGPEVELLVDFNASSQNNGSKVVDIMMYHVEMFISDHLLIASNRLSWRLRKPRSLFFHLQLLPPLQTFQG